MRRKVFARALERARANLSPNTGDVCAALRERTPMRITWRPIRSFLIESTSAQRSAGASVEKIFDLGKTDTVTPFATWPASNEIDFHRAREIRIRFAICVKT